MNYFLDYLKRTDDRLLTKWAHYFVVYERELERLRSRPITFLEIGVFRGGSIPMWKGYFHPDSKLIFADIDPNCRKVVREDVALEIGDQSDPAFLEGLARKHGPFDVILDDGGHYCDQQRTSLQHLWPHVNNGGLYLVEDTHTSYCPAFGGGHQRPGSFIEHAKGLIDQMHSWYSEDKQGFPLHDRARDLASVRFYDSVVVLERSLKRARPTQVTSINGQVETSQRALDIDRHVSVFQPNGQRARG